MASLKKLVTTTLLALIASVSITLPMHADAAQRTAAKKKAIAHQKQVKLAPTGQVASRTISRTTSRVVMRGGKRVVVRQAVSLVHFEPARPSFGQLYGLHNTADSLELKSSVALVVDQDTNEVLFSKNSDRKSVV